MRSYALASFVSPLALTVGLCLGATPAFAVQDTTGTGPADCSTVTDPAAQQACEDNQADAPATAAPAPAGQSGDIVVTGSRLRRDERNSPDPVTIIDPSLEAREGKFSTAEVLQSSPLAAGSTQITSTLSTNFVVNGGEGVETISLRGLGSNRTLVLLNGRRAGPAGVRGGVSSFDLNVIPTDAIQNVEILKTGASSVYGSDAIAGVVNLITKKDVDGFEIRGFSSIPTHSGGEQYNISGIYGHQLGERGHFTVGVNYQRQNELERGDRSFLGCPEENVTNYLTGRRSDPIDPRTNQPYCGDFRTDQIDIFDFTPYFGLPTNLLGPPVPNATGGTSRRPITTIAFNNPGRRFNEFLTPIAPPTNPLQFSGPAGFFPIGAYSATGLALANNYDYRADSDSVIPKTDRFTVFGEAGYDLTDRVSLYFEGLYNRRKTKTDASRQLFFDQYTGDTIVGLPYYYCDGTSGTCDPFAAGDPLNTGFTGAQFLTPIIYAPFDSSTDVKYYRGLAGLRADISNILPKGFVDFYFQHSRSDGDYARDIIYRDAIEFNVAELRTDLCAGTLTAIRGVPCIDINYTDPRVLRGDFTPEERAFLFGVDRGNTLYKQNTAELSFGGDLFSLPAGKVKFALGGQWRRDEIRDVPGEASLTDNVWGSTTSGITAGFQRTTEVFGEVEVPILKDMPAIKELTINGAARRTSTFAKRAFDGASDSDKGNWTYKLAANWQVAEFLRLRYTYGTSFRSPALFEQFLADESGFLGQGLDPCRLLQQRLTAGTVSQRVFDNCTSQGIPTNHNTGGASLESFSGGGVGQLDPETSKAKTFSVILTPQTWFWSGGRFSLAIDYVDIKVKDQVTQLGAANILNGCYSSDNFPDDPLCSLFVRDTTGLNPSFNILTVQDPYLNIDTQHNTSIDFTSRFRQDLGSLGTLSLLGQLTVQLKDKFTLFQGFTDDNNGQVGDPKWVGDLNVTWNKAPFTLTYGLQVIGATNDIEDLKDLGLPLTQNNCIASAAAFALRGGPYCPVYKFPRVAYHSLSGEIEVNKNFTFLLGVSNIFDKKPPLVSIVGSPISAFGQVSTSGSYYDYFGRRIFASARAKF